MQCQKCKQHSATIHLTEIHSGQRHEMHLCPSCAEQEGFAIKNQVPLNELLSTLLAAQSPSDDNQFEIGSDGHEQLSCDLCGITFDQFRQQALLGCAGDYEAFKKPLKVILDKAHNGATVHMGKVPSGAPQDTQIQVKLADMQKQLDLAVKNENYELAAQLRDQIERMK